jgi:branched-chain amino acid transport system ATP-binding protein
VRDLAAGYQGIPVIRSLSLHVGYGEVVALLGPNGAGKTTTLLTLAGVLPAIEGTLDVAGQPVPGRRPHLVARRGVALVPEDRGLFHQLTVGENLRLARRKGTRITAAEVLEYFPVLEPLLGRRCGLLSGGEQQMLGVAKALAGGPRVLMIDELTHGLAPIIVERLLPVIRHIATEQRIAVLLVEQHTQMALEIADRAYLLDHGRLVMEGDARQLLDRPDLLAATYFGARPKS